MPDSTLKRIFLIAGACLFVYVLVMIWLLTGKTSDAPIDSIDTGAVTTGTSEEEPVTSGDIARLPTTEPIVATGPIYIAIPKRFLTPGIQEMVTTFVKEQKRPVKFQTFLDMNEYKKFLSTEVANGATTVALLPSDWLDTYKPSLYTIRLQSRAKELFHTVAHTFTANDGYTFVPFALDPLVSIFDTSIDFDMQDMTLDDIYAYFGAQKKYKATDIPFVFWFDAQTAAVLRLNQEPRPGYRIVLYQMLKSRFATNNTQAIKSLLDMTAYPVVYFNYATIQKYIDQEQTKGSECRLFPHICMLAADYSQFSFWFVSDMLVFEKYFSSPWTGKNQNLTVWPFVQYNPVLPTRVRGRVVSRASADLIPWLEWINTYIQSCANNNARLRWFLSLPACVGPYSDKIMDPAFTLLRPYLSTMTPMEGGAYEVENFFTQTKVIDTLEKNYNVDLFFTRPNWEFE